jgi:hypothetical protein
MLENRVSNMRLENWEKELLKLAEIVKKANEILLHKSQKTMEATKMHLEESSNKIKL